MSAAAGGTAFGVGGFAPTEEQLANPSPYNPFGAVRYAHQKIRTHNERIYPRAEQSGKNGVPYNYYLPADQEKWTVLQSARVQGNVKVTWDKSLTKEESWKLENENWGLINNYLHSLFSKVVVKIGGCEIADPAFRTYPYKAYLVNLFNKNRDFKETILKNSGWYEDEAKKGSDCFNALYKKTTADKNIGMHAKYNEKMRLRREKLEKGNLIEFDIPLYHDVATADRFLPPGYDLEFTLYRNEDNFIFLQPTAAENTTHASEAGAEGDIQVNSTAETRTTSTSRKYTIELENVFLSIEKKELDEVSLREYTSKAFKEEGVIPLTRNLLRSYTVVSGRTDFGCHNFIQGKQMPETIIVGFVLQSAYDGNVHKNPFDFMHIPMKQASLVVNSVHIPAQPFDTSSKTGTPLYTFHKFLETLGGSDTESICGTIDFDKFYGGYFFLAFDLTPNKDNRAKRHELGPGTISLNLIAETEATENITVIVYTSYSSTIHLDGSQARTRTF